MNKRIVLFLGLFAISIIIVACEDDASDPATAVPPVFSNTPVYMEGPYDSSDLTYGDIKMVAPVITPFGAALDPYHLSPAIEYFTRPDAPVLAVTTGVVETILANPPEEADYQIWVRCLPGSDYKVIYDHVLNPTAYILQNVLVEPGDTMGLAGTWSAGMRRTELQINNDAGDEERAYCPLNFGDSLFIDAHQKLLDEYNQRGFAPHYNSLCLTGTVIP